MTGAEVPDVHNYRRGTTDHHTPSRQCACSPTVIPWRDGSMVVHNDGDDFAAHAEGYR